MEKQEEYKVKYKNMEQKESKSSKHFNISMVKSAVRIAAYTMLAFNYLWMAGLVLIMAEGLGVAEEL
jgi:hypothetical protein